MTTLTLPEVLPACADASAWTMVRCVVQTCFFSLCYRSWSLLTKSFCRQVPLPKRANLPSPMVLTQDSSIGSCHQASIPIPSSEGLVNEACAATQRPLPCEEGSHGEGLARCHGAPGHRHLLRTEQTSPPATGKARLQLLACSVYWVCVCERLRALKLITWSVLFSRQQCACRGRLLATDTHSDS